MNTWDASAGIDNGSLRNCIKLAINPNQGMRDILYKNMINPIVSFNGQGTVVWGQKTLQSKPSASKNIGFALINNINIVVGEYVIGNKEFYGWDTNYDHFKAA
jgi:hypothetical protein